MPLPSRMGRHVQGLLLMIATSELAMGRVRVAGHPGCLRDVVSIGVFRRLAQVATCPMVSCTRAMHPTRSPWVKVAPLRVESAGGAGCGGDVTNCCFKTPRQAKLQSVFANCNSDEGG